VLAEVKKEIELEIACSFSTSLVIPKLLITEQSGLLQKLKEIESKLQ